MFSASNMSLYIPRVFSNITEEKIIETFDKLGLGLVHHIDMVAKQASNGKIYNSVYVHFEYWYNNIAAENFQNRLRNPNKETRVVYDDPWYWIVLENKTRRFIPGERKQCINIPDNISTNAVMETPDKDYNDIDMDICHTPIKNKDNYECMSISDDEFDDVCRKIEFDDVAYEADMMESGRSWNYLDTEMMDLVPEENFDLVDADYVAQLEHVNKVLQDENIGLKQEIEYIRNIYSKYELYDGYAF